MGAIPKRRTAATSKVGEYPCDGRKLGMSTVGDNVRNRQDSSQTLDAPMERLRLPREEGNGDET